jgi:hypothetical protein
MPDQEVLELKEAISQVRRDLVGLTDLFVDVRQKLARISKSLRYCQSRCHVDNPGRWSKFWTSVSGIFSRDPRGKRLELEEVEVKDPAKGIVR